MSPYQEAVEALRKIAAMDWRGHEPEAVVIARQTLEKIRHVATGDDLARSDQLAREAEQ